LRRRRRVVFFAAFLAVFRRRRVAFFAVFFAAFLLRFAMFANITVNVQWAILDQQEVQKELRARYIHYRAATICEQLFLQKMCG
jgi:hypothetical protein